LLQYGEDDPSSMIVEDGKGFEFNFQVVGILCFVFLVVIGEIFHVYLHLPVKPTIDKEEYIWSPELCAEEMGRATQQRPVEFPSPAWIDDYENFDSYELLKSQAASPPDIKPSSYRIEAIMPIPSPKSSNQDHGPPLMLPARSSTLLLGSQAAHQGVALGAGELLIHRPVVASSVSGPIPSKGYILSDFESAPKALPVHTHDDIPARSLIPFATPRKLQRYSSQDTPMASKPCSEGPTFNETVSSGNDNSTFSPAAILVETKNVQNEDARIKAPAPAAKARKFALTPSTFDKFVRKNDCAFVAFYHASSNPNEAYFTPLWKEFALDVREHALPLAPAFVDCDRYEALCQEQGIRHYPTLRWFNSGKPVFPDNADPRTFPHLIVFAKYSILRQEQANAADETKVKQPPSSAVVDAMDASAKGVVVAARGQGAKKARRARKQVPAKPRKAEW